MTKLETVEAELGLFLVKSFRIDELGNVTEMIIEFKEEYAKEFANDLLDWYRTTDFNVDGYSTEDCIKEFKKEYKNDI